MKVTPSLPQRGRQPKGCAPLTPRKSKLSNTILAQRGPDEAAERPPKGGLAHIFKYFCEMILG